MAKKNTIELAELILRCEAEREYAAACTQDRNAAAAAEAEERADRLHDQILDLARDIVTDANREAGRITSCVRTARACERKEKIAWSRLSRRQDIDSTAHCIDTRCYNDCVAEYQRSLRSTTRAIKRALRAVAPWVRSLDMSLIEEMRAAYLDGFVELPLTNADVWDHYSLLCEELLTA